MENKYQEALDTLHLVDEHYRKAAPIFEEKYKETPYLVIQELVDKTKKPKPTEQQILKKFFKIGFVTHYSEDFEELIDLINIEEMSVIKINKESKRYIKVDSVYYSDFVPISLKEHQLLHELFTVWGWVE